MPKWIEGKLVAAPGAQFAIVAARFNELVVNRLLEGCLEGLRRHGVDDANVTVVKVPGSFELAVTAKALARKDRFQAIICLGAVIQGGTDHYDYVCSGAVSGIASAGLETGVPVIFGVLTCQSLEQALDRAGGKAGNKGHDAALCAIEMASVLSQVK